MRRRKILVILHSFQLGGAEIVACKLVTELRGFYDYIVAALDGSGKLQEQLAVVGIPCFSFCRRPGIDLGLVTRLAQLLRHHKCDLIHAHQYTPFAYALLTRSQTNNIPILFTEHGRFAHDRRRICRVLANRLLLHHNDRITAVSRSVRDALVRNEGIARRRITVIPNGIDVNHYMPASASEKLKARKALGLPTNCFTVVTVARLDPIKDHFTAIRAFQHVHKVCPHSRFLIVGDGPEYGRIKAFITDLGLESAVNLCGQQVETLSYYQAADSFLLTSLSEGMPLTVLEAMSCALPIVSTACGAVPELVGHGKTGFLAPVHGYELLGDYLVQLAKHPEIRATMGIMGRTKCTQQYSWSTVLARYADICNEMLGLSSKVGNHDYLPVFC